MGWDCVELWALRAPLSNPHDTWMNMEQRWNDIDEKIEDLGGGGVLTRAKPTANHLSYDTALEIALMADFQLKARICLHTSPI